MLIDLLESSKAIGLCPMGILKTMESGGSNFKVHTSRFILHTSYLKVHT